MISRHTKHTYLTTSRNSQSTFYKLKAAYSERGGSSNSVNCPIDSPSPFCCCLRARISTAFLRRAQALIILRLVASSTLSQYRRSSRLRKHPLQNPLGPDSHTPMHGLGISKNSSCWDCDFCSVMSVA